MAGGWRGDGGDGGGWRGMAGGRSAIRMGLRQMFVGALAAAVTYGVGHLIGAHVS
jgi:VIT1/CCC1 family predicted Fe2+/Mn2+ transporter